MHLFIYFYYFILCVIYVIALPILILMSFFKKYRQALPTRFLFSAKNMPFKENGVWFHACSYGEVTSLSPLLNVFDDDEVNLSVITQTGFEKGKKLTSNVRYLPFEIFIPFWARKQKVLVVTEAELWLMLFYIMKKKGAKTILVNARVSDHSYHKYKRFTWFYKIIFSYVDEVYAQTNIDKTRLEELGAKNVKVSGNIKSSLLPKITKYYNANTGNKKVVTLASTHIGEEILILDQLNKVDLSNKMIIIVPRHPERFDAVHKLAQAWANTNGKTYSRFSKDGFNEPSDIMLCDVMDELINIYAVTHITILGGSFIEGVGGHNPLEPAAFNNSIISGRFFHNQKPLYDLVEGITICDVEDISKYIKMNLPKTTTTHLEHSSEIVDSIKSALK